ncbi:MAG TPA: PRC-barrel domain-containing protein [Gemmatimonadaceae bacterium]|nr:PRC-barrel domain-containing protein [Gemmatimonadaceae bacterium]
MARLDDRGGRDSAGFGPYHRPDAELVPLRELGDWQLGEGEPDIRGWEVRTIGDRTIGTVRDLLVDRAAREVVLLDIDLEGGDRRGRAPIRAAQIDRRARVIRLDSADLIGAADMERGLRTERDLATDRDLRPGEPAVREREVDRAIAAHAADIRTRDRELEARHHDAEAARLRDLDVDEARRREAEAARLRDVDEARRRDAGVAGAVPPTREAMRDDRAERLADRAARQEPIPEPERARDAASGLEEKVVETRPLVVEEVVVRRRVVDEEKAAPPEPPRDVRREP